MVVTVTNNGETSVTVSGIAVSNSKFTSSSLSLPAVLPAGQSVDLSVSFTPAAMGAAEGTMEISSNASNATLALGVRGTGVSSELVTASPSSVSFGQVTVGASSTVPVVLTNDRSSSKITLSALQTTGSEFSMSGPTLPLTLDAGQSVTVNVTFAPQAAGTDGGSLFVYGPTLAIPLEGTGTATLYSVNLFWNSSPDVAGYNVYRSTTATGGYSRINSTLDSNTAYTDGTVVSGKTYYYAATSVTSSGQESARSTPPVQAAVP
jgi:Abnormal spindle-like microcephaly-assoc'd, ASPM-SPD-2-Hydin